MAKKQKGEKGSTKGKNKATRDTNKADKGSRSSSSNGKSNKSRAKMMDVTDDDFKFRHSLESDGLTVVDMAADGNCLFRAISDQLYGDYGNCHEEIRSDICDFMEEKKEDFAVFLVLDDDSCEEGDDGKDFESYIRTMREDGEWGGNLELVAAARLYQRKVTVFSATLSAYSIEPGEVKSSGPDILVSFHDNDHYNSVRDEKSPPKPPPRRNKEKTRQLGHEAGEREQSHASDSTATSATASSSVSDMSIDNKAVPEDSVLSQTKKQIKKSASCPCGSGLRYKKCCHAKQKHAARLGKLKAEESPEKGEDEDEVAMKGNFRVLQI